MSFGGVTSSAYTAPRTVHVLSAELVGTITTPTSSGPGALLIAFGQVGGPGTVIWVGGTLTTVIPPIPEPLSVAVLGNPLTIFKGLTHTAPSQSREKSPGIVMNLHVTPHDVNGNLCRHRIMEICRV